MRHPDYRYVNVAVEGVHNRKGIYDIRKLGDPSGKTETYCTYFRYNDEMVKHFRKRRSVAGYQGKAYADWLPIDIDSDDLQQAQMMLQRLIYNLEAYDIDLNTCRFYFSGSKGFHVMIPSQYFGAEPSKDIHKRFRKVAIELAKGIDIDTAIYDKTRILRLPNTKHGKSGLHKVELYPFEATTLDIRDIQQKALIPTERLEIEKEFDPSEELTELYHEDLNKKKINGEQGKTKVKVCMSKLMTGVGQGERDNVGVRVASHLRQSGLTPKMIYAALEEWNKTNDPPLDDDEIDRIFEQGLQDYEFGCHDEILKTHCSKECIFYQEDWGRF